MTIITIERKILERNDDLARLNRERFRAHGIVALNLVSAPGSGKTSLLEQTLARLSGRLSVQIVEGDVQTDLDARRLARFDVPVVQLVTNGACHLEAGLVRDALDRLPLREAQLLIIENVGNLVCPAAYDLGEDLKVVMLSVAEGDDKPLKYPAMFRNARVLIVNKTDLLPHVPCDIERLIENAHQINPELKVFRTSCTSGDGIDEWCEWLLETANAASRGASG